MYEMFEDGLNVLRAVMLIVFVEVFVISVVMPKRQRQFCWCRPNTSRLLPRR